MWSCLSPLKNAPVYPQSEEPRRTCLLALSRRRRPGDRVYVSAQTEVLLESVFVETLPRDRRRSHRWGCCSLA